MVLKKYALYLFLLAATMARAQFNYGHQMDFGKNRIQFKELVWTYLDYDRYRVYFYQGGIEHAKYISLSAARQINMFEKRLDYPLDEKINILVYNTQEDFKQSNLGLSSEEQNNTGGLTRIIGDKVSVFFNGSHTEFDQQLRAALAELFVNKMLYGGNAREMIRNSTLLYIPEWYSNGLVKYLSEGWTTVNDNLMYDGLKNDDFGSFNRLTGKQAANAGHALWYYIATTYGESLFHNILYMTRVMRSIDNAFVSTIGVTLDNLIYDFNESYNRRLYLYRDSTRRSPINNSQSVLKKYRDTKHYYQVKISPDGNQVIYAVNELNQLKVYLTALDGGSKRLLKLNPKVEQLDDYNYPLLAWHPTGKAIIMVYPRKGEMVLHTRNLETGENIKRPLPGFEKINSISFNDDGKKLALSAVKKGRGQSDIFVFSINTSALEQLTNDIWDDNNPVFVKKSRQIVFESNRVNDTVKATDDANFFVKFNRNMDLFMAPYPFSTRVLVRVTQTPDYNEVQPQACNSNYLSYLSDKNGVFNRYMATFDSSIAFVDTVEHYRYFFKSKAVTNYDRSILEQHINTAGTVVAERYYVGGRDRLQVSPLQEPDQVKTREPMNTWFRSVVNPAVSNPGDYKDNKTGDNASAPKNDNQSKGIDFENYRLEGEQKPFNDAKKQAPPARGDSLANNRKLPKPFKFPIQKNYNTAFYTDYVVTQFDNAFLANNYQVFSNSGTPIYLNPGFNLVTKVAISDLFEDMRIVGGFRINPYVDNEYMLSWEQRRGKIDHQFLIDRQTFSKVSEGTISGTAIFSRINTYSARYSMKIPFSAVSSLRFSLLYRLDRKVYLSESDIALTAKNSWANMAGVRAEYIYDNTRKVMLNILNGFRAKVWTEYWMYAGNNDGDLFTSGFDARHYQRVHRQITWCNRFAGGNSLGSERLLFYLGGVDNWFNPSFNNNINILHTEQYGFQTLATNMRGFKQNIRNGNNFLLYNSELRIPVVRYFIDYPLRSDFLNNLQIIGFSDVGMAWYGSNPLSSENTENSQAYIQNNPATGSGGTGIIVTITTHKNPLVGGMGFGFRSRLLGYFVRLDFGWGIDNWEVQQRVVGLSLTTDF